MLDSVVKSSERDKKDEAEVRKKTGVRKEIRTGMMGRKREKS